MESKSEWEKELDKYLEFREFFERQTRRSVSYEIMDFLDQSREAGRSEQFLSGLQVAASIADSTYEQDQLTLLEFFKSAPPIED
jgi:hypothetical protein